MPVDTPTQLNLRHVWSIDVHQVFTMMPHPTECLCASLFFLMGRRPVAKPLDFNHLRCEIANRG